MKPESIRMVFIAVWSAWVVLATACAAWPAARAASHRIVRALLVSMSLASCAIIAIATHPWRVAAVPQSPQSIVSASVLPFRSCAAVELGMKKADVIARVGKPDAIESAEDTRGTGAVCWRYGSRCAVYLVDDVVQFVE